MQNVRFIKERGYLYDLYFVFVLHFNKEHCLKHFINGNKSTADTEFFNKLLLEYEEMSQDLLPFFYLHNSGYCFMTQYYFNNRIQELAAGYNLAAVLESISDHEQVLLNLLQFYFPDADYETIHKSEKRMVLVGQLIKQSDYSDALKNGLYALILDSDAVIHKLYYELMKTDFQLSQQYERKMFEITQVQQHLSIEKLSKRWSLCKDITFDLNEFDNVLVSFCSYNKNCLRYEFLEDTVFVILGTDYADCMEYCISQYQAPKLGVVGNALAENNRIDILDLIMEKKEVTIKDIEQTLKFTGTNAYYHLSLMIRANLLCVRNQGRTVLYSINKQCFAAVSEILQKYAV